MTPKFDYCTQNNGHCETCSLTSYGRDCQNKPLPRFEVLATTEDDTYQLIRDTTRFTSVDAAIEYVTRYQICGHYYINADVWYCWDTGRLCKQFDTDNPAIDIKIRKIS